MKNPPETPEDVVSLNAKWLLWGLDPSQAQLNSASALRRLSAMRVRNTARIAARVVSSGLHIGVSFMPLAMRRL
jgi:hypothetical protein